MSKDEFRYIFDWVVLIGGFSFIALYLLGVSFIRAWWERKLHFMRSLGTANDGEETKD